MKIQKLEKGYVIESPDVLNDISKAINKHYNDGNEQIFKVSKNHRGKNHFFNIGFKGKTPHKSIKITNVRDASITKDTSEHDYSIAGHYSREHVERATLYLNRFNKKEEKELIDELNGKP